MWRSHCQDKIFQQYRSTSVTEEPETAKNNAVDGVKNHPSTASPKFSSLRKQSSDKTDELFHATDSPEIQIGESSFTSAKESAPSDADTPGPDRFANPPDRSTNSRFSVDSAYAPSDRSSLYDNDRKRPESSYLLSGSRTFCSAFSIRSRDSGYPSSQASLGILDLEAVYNKNNFLRTEFIKLQIDNNQLLGGIEKIKDEKTKIEQTLENLQRQKYYLQNHVNKLLNDNYNLYTQVSQLQDVKASLDKRFDLLKNKCATLQEESKAPGINPSQESHCHLSSWTIDSGMGESELGRGASSRKRQISVTDGREEERRRSLHFLREDDGTGLPIMHTYI